MISDCYKMTDKTGTEAIRKQCARYLPLKKRYCRMQASKGSEYCGEHFDFGRKDNSGEKKRIRCPLDPTQFSPSHAHCVCVHSSLGYFYIVCIALLLIAKLVILTQ